MYILCLDFPISYFKIMDMKKVIDGEKKTQFFWPQLK
jgi:hypothetical protein